MPVIKAASEGKTIQIKGLHYSEWTDIDCNFGYLFHEKDEENGFEYRIKPEPKLRPWTPEEVPVGARIRSIEALECGGRIINGMIVYVLNQNKLGYCDTTGQREWNFDGALECLEYSIDGGKTWKPCGIQE